MRWGIRTALRVASGTAVLAASVALPASGLAGPATPVRVGNKPPAAREARVVGALSASVRMHLTVVLKPRDPSGLAAYARAVSTPGASLFHEYLTPAEFADRFGATTHQAQAVSASLRAHGLTPGRVSANRLSIPVTAPAGQVEHAFSVSFHRLALSGGRRATVATAAPALDPSIAPDVQTVLGLSSTDAFHPQDVRRATAGGVIGPRTGHSRPHVATGGPQPCGPAQTAAAQQGAYTADQIASAYGFSSLYQAGDEGQGETIAVYELEPDDPNDIAAYESCYGIHASVSYVPVDGGAGSGEGTGEAALDIENSIGLAPRANYLVYQGRNSNSGAPGAGPYDTFNAIITQDRAQVVSVSWGECEPQDADGLQAEATLFQEAAVQGQTVVSASGDEGSEDCNGSPPQPPDFALEVDDPASQPFVTGVGGTTLSSLGPPPSQTVWNDGPTSQFTGTGGAGGGGISQAWAMPAYQSDAAAGLHVIGPDSSGAPCGVTSGSCREVPDVSANADPTTGYLVYWNGSGDDRTEPTGWQTIGGTSAASPVWAALLALTDASSACHSTPIGFANPALYTVASTAYASTFTDVTSGNNDLTSTNGGLYPAGSGFDMASGLGTPVGGALASALCTATVRILSPGSQRASAGQRVSLQLKLSGQLSGGVTWRASGLPPGLSISASTGRISGTPLRGGSFSVAVSGTYQGAPLPQTKFTWTVIGVPTVSRVSLTGVGVRRPTLSLTVSHGLDSAPLRSVTVAVPAGLRFGSISGSITVTGPRGRRIKVKASIAQGRLRIRLSSPQTAVGVRIRYAGISSTPALAGRVRGHRVRSLRVTVTATDTTRRTTTVTAQVRPG